MLRPAVIALLLLPSWAAVAADLPCRPASFFEAPAGAPYKAEEARVPTRDGHELVGTLTLPAAGGPAAAVLLITGSGPQTRDMALHAEEPLSLYRPFRQIADALGRRGIAALRLDDRGVACSARAPAGDPTMPELADDSRDALAYLRKRAEIDPARLALLGMSEGADIAIIIAADDPTVAAVVAMGGAGATGLVISEFQHRHLISTGVMTPEERLAVSRGTSEEQILAQRMADVRARGLDGQLGRWFKHFLTYNPLPTAAKVRCPALILHGRRDTQIPVDNALTLGAAMRAGGNDKVTVQLLDGLNHLFLEDDNGTFVLYAKLMQTTNQMPERVPALVGDWLAETLAAPKG